MVYHQKVSTLCQGLIKMKTKIAVISDVHANADALTVVLEELKNKSVDMTIFLGDILTYGCQPLEVVRILKEYESKCSTIFIKGNHDQFYFDLQSSIKKLSYKLPKFVGESVNWTLKKISPLLLKDIFTWHDSYRIGDVYFSHANPFEYGDWSYIEKPEYLYKSFQELRKKNVFSGVFGHSHRQLFIGSKENTLYEMDKYSSVDNADNIDQLIINTGSVGQPRGKGLGYVFLEIKNDKLFKASFKKIKINLENSINLIQQTKFSQETKKKLIDYLEV
jgi:predicted phosphodiesterase